MSLFIIVCIMNHYNQRWSREHKARGQGHKKISRPRTKDTDASVLQKKRSSKLFSGDLKKKRSSKNFFWWFLLEETKEKVFADFLHGVWRFPTKFQRFKNSAVLGLEASRPRPRTSKCVLEDVFEAKDVLEDSTTDYKILEKMRIRLYFGEKFLEDWNIFNINQKVETTENITRIFVRLLIQHGQK